MRALGFGFGVAIVLLAIVVGSVRSEVYIVTIEGEPIISYRGDIDGFEATVVESDDEQIDTTR